MQKKKLLKKIASYGVEKLFLLSACVAVLALLVIGVYILVSGLPGMFKIGVGQFLFKLCIYAIKKQKDII